MGAVGLAAGTEVRVWMPGAAEPRVYDVEAALAGHADGISKVTRVRFSNADPAMLDIEYQDAIRGARWAILDTRDGTVEPFGWGYVAATAIGPGQALVQNRDASLRRWTRENPDELFDPTRLHLGAFETSADGTWMAGVTEDRRIVTWDLETGRRRQVEVLERGGIRLQARGAFVAVRLEDVVYVVNRTGQIVRKLHHGDAINASRWLDEHTFETRSTEVLRTWTIPTTPTLDGHRGGVGELAFVGSDRILSVGMTDRDIRLWDLSTGASKVLREGPAAAVVEFDVSPDLRYALVTLTGQESFVVDLETLERVSVPASRRAAHFWSERAIVYTPRVLMEDQGVYEYDLEDGVEREVTPDAKQCTVLDASHQGEVGTKCTDGFFRIWGRDGTLRWEAAPEPTRPPAGTHVLVTGDIPTVMDSMRVGPQGRYAWEGNLLMGGPSVIMDRETNAMLLTKPLRSNFAFHPTAPWIVGCEARELLKVSLTDGSTKTPALAFDDDVRSVALSPDGSQIAYGTERGEIRIRTDPVPYEPEALRDFVRANQPTIDP